MMNTKELTKINEISLLASGNVARMQRAWRELTVGKAGVLTRRVQSCLCIWECCLVCIVCLLSIGSYGASVRPRGSHINTPSQVPLCWQH